MAKSTAPKVSIDDLVNAGLVKLAAGGDWRLLAATKAVKGPVHPHLFDDKSASAKCVADGLVTVTGKGATEKAALTAAGFSRVAGAIPDEHVGPAAKALAEPLPLAERIAFLDGVIAKSPTAALELLPIKESAVAEEKAEQEAKAAREAKRRERETAAADAMRAWLALADARKRDRIAALRAALAAEEGVTNPMTVGPEGRVEPLPPIATEADADFRRQLSRRLVASWLAACRTGKDEGRRLLETVIGNIGAIHEIGEEGAAVPFDGARHEAERPVRDGEMVKVVRSGWVLDEGDGAYLLAPAQVE